MCGRFVLDATTKLLTEVYNLQTPIPITPRFNIAPSQQIAVIRQLPLNGRGLSFLKWGLVPHWAKDPNIGYKMINARSETAHEKPSFKNAFQSRRCIIPASGFYEWERRGKEKRPHYFHLKNEPLMSLAGLWETWRSPDGEEIESCTILTTNANDLVKPLHDRMPVLLSLGDVGQWLDVSFTGMEALMGMLVPSNTNAIEEWEVSREVNSPSNDSPSCIVPV